MASLKAVIHKHALRNDGTYNVKIRLLHGGKAKYISTLWYVSKSDLTKSFNIKNKAIVDLVDNIIRRYREKLTELGEAVESMSVTQIYNCLVEVPQKEEPFRLDIFDYIQRHIEELEAQGRTGNARTFHDMKLTLRHFINKGSLDINDITSKTLNDWARWMVGTGVRHPLKASTAQNYLSKLKVVFNKAKLEYNDEDAGSVPIPRNPFARVTKLRVQPADKRAITVEQLMQIIAMPGRSTNGAYFKIEELARDMFVLSFCLMGMNAADLYELSDYSNGRITYCRRKTRERRLDRALISVKVLPLAAEIISRYSSPRRDRVLCLSDHYSTLAGLNSTLNRGLKVIGEKIGVPALQFYAARHTWATIANNEARVNKYRVHEALNHVDPTMKITDIYIRPDWSGIDQANLAVFRYLGLDTGE